MSELTIARVNGFRVKVIGNWLTGYRVKYRGVTSDSKTSDKLLALRWGCYLVRELNTFHEPVITHSFNFRGEGRYISYGWSVPEDYWFTVFK